MADLIENCRRHRVMIGLLTVLGALLLGARAQQQGLVGGDVTLVPKYTGDLKEISWTLNDRIFVELILKPEEEFIHNLPNDRATINKTNGVLTIRNLERGDSGLYRAQVILMDDYIQVTEIRLTVHDCPDQPIISAQSNEDQFVVSCKSFSPDVTYEWFNPTTSVSKSPFYTEPKKSGTLTCVVDNKVCNKSSSINFYIAAQPEEKSVGDDVILVPQYTGDPSEIIWKVNGYNLVKMMLKPRVDRFFHRLQDRATINDTDGRLTIRHLTTEDSGDYTAVVLVNDEYYYTEIRLKPRDLSGWIIVGLVIVVPSLLATIINFFFLLWYYYDKKLRYLSVRGVVRIVFGVLSLFTTIINFIFLLWYFFYKQSRLPSRFDICLTVVVGFLFPITTLIIIILMWYYCYKKSSDLSGWVIATIVLVGVLSPFFIQIIFIFLPFLLFLLWNCYKNEKCPKKLSTQDEMTTFQTQGSNIGGAEESERCITVKFCYDDKSQTEESCMFWKKKGTQSPRLNLLSVGEGIFTAEAVMSDRKEGTFTDGTEPSVKIDLWVDRKTNYKPDTKHVKELVWKKDGVTLFKWAVSSLKFLTSNIKLKQESVTVNNAEGKKSYKVTVYDAEGKKSYKVFFRLEEPPESKSICIITFHHSKMTDIDRNTWKKDSQPVNIDGDRIKCEPNGDLTINNVTPKDKGTYTVQCIDNELYQEFILH